MKSILLLCFFFVTFFSKSQNNDLNPNSTWHCWDVEGTSQCKDTYNYNLYFNGDSIINGNQYFKMYKSGYMYYSQPSGTCNAPPTYYNYFEALVRYYQNKLLFFNSISDVTYIDYNLQIGDTIKNVMFDNSNFYNLKVTRIDSVNVNGNYLNRFFYQSSTSPDTGYVIEKIGSNHGFISEFTPFFESYKELICYAENNMTVYNNPGFLHASCDITLNLKSNDLNSSQLEIYPNPASNEFKINNKNGDQIKKASIKNYLGQFVMEFQLTDTTSSFDISSLENGIYFIVLETKTGSEVKKIVKQ